MTDMAPIHGSDGIDSLLKLEPLTVEALSDVRYIHASAFRLMASPFFGDEEIAAFGELVSSSAYSDQLMSAVRQQQLIGARLGGDLVGTAGWSHGDGASPTARMQWLYVRPLFNDCGIGRRLVAEIELRVMAAGYRATSVRSTVNAVEFFQHLGYQITSRGIQQLTSSVALPVVYMRKLFANIAAHDFRRH